jgi:phosphate transport system permease protein
MMRSGELQAKRTIDPIQCLVWIVSSTFFAGLLLILGLWITQAWPAISTYGFQLIAGKEWFYRDQSFGASGMIYGSIVVSLIALCLAAPVAISAAVFISEFLSPRLRPIVKAMVEFLAAVPSVVYGLLGILLLRERIADLLIDFDPLSGDMLLTAGVLLAVMILPTIATFSEDALRAVSQEQRLAARGLGMNRGETILHVVLPRAWPGILGAALLGTGRALGETIAVFLVVGRLDNQLPEKFFSLRSLIEPGQTLTSKLGGPETHIALGDPLHWGAILNLGLILLVLSALFVSTGTLLRKLRRTIS